MRPTSVLAQFTAAPLPPAARIPASGYGKKLPTSAMATVQNGGSRKHRVYATRWGNAGSAWFQHHGVKYFLPDTADYDNHWYNCDAAD